MTINVTNAAPVAGNDAYSVQEGNTLTIVAPGLLANDTDADGDTISATNYTQPSHGTLTQVVTDGSFQYVPDAGFVGVDTWTYFITDGAGSATGTVTITVTAGNVVPVADDETYTIRPGQTLTVTAPGVLDGDTDADGDALNVASVNITGLQGTLNPQVDGSFSFTPNSGFTGTTSFTYAVSDGFGGFDSGLVTINVINSAPVADDETYTVHAGQALTVTAPGILDGDTDADGDALTVASVNITGLQGTMNPQANGGFVFTPTAGFTGATSFTYAVSDGFGGFDTGSGDDQRHRAGGG